jgi:hypothetical protein
MFISTLAFLDDSLGSRRDAPRLTYHLSNQANRLIPRKLLPECTREGQRMYHGMAIPIFLDPG